MEPFVKLFQPDRYANWMQGKDSLSIDHTHPTPATTPELQSWLQRRRKTKHTNKRYCIYTYFFHNNLPLTVNWLTLVKDHTCVLKFLWVIARIPLYFLSLLSSAGCVAYVLFLI